MSDYEDRNDDDSGFYAASNKESEQENVQEEQPAAKTSKKKTIKKSRKERAPQTKKGKDEKKNTVLKNEGLLAADEIIENMKKKKKEDEELTRTHKLANKKLAYSKIIEKELRNIYVCEGFLELHGLNMFEEWLTKEEEGVEPSLTLKLRLFKILLELNVNEQHIAYAGELQKIIHKNKRSMVKDLRDLSDAIITKWGRIAYDDINE